MTTETLLVLLGSGATISEVGGVWDITEKLAKNPNFNAARVFPDRPKDESLFEFIATLSNISLDSPDYNFENTLSILETIQSDRSSGRKLLATSEHRVSAANDIGTVYQELCYDVLFYLKDRRSQLTTDGKNLPLVNGLEELSKVFDLKVFSLNYDDVPLISDIPFFDGYMGGNDHFSPEALLNKDVPGREKHWHVPLHGSLRFGPALYRHEQFGRVPTIPKYPSIDEASTKWCPITEMPPYQFERWDDSFAVGLLNIPMPMITGFRKSDRALHEPYMTYFQAFRELLRSSKKWLVIGYGANDAHINAHMRTALFDKAWNKPEEYYESLVVAVGWMPRNTPAEVLENQQKGLLEAAIGTSQPGFEWLGDEDWSSAIARTVMRWGSPYWYKENEDWNEVGITGRITRNSFSKLTNRLSVCFDGGNWALGEGLGALIEELSANPIPMKGGR